MKITFKVLFAVIFLLSLASCASQPAEPTPTEVPPPTDTPLPPDPIEIVEEFLKAASEDRTEDAFSFLAEDVGLILDQCRYGDDARAILKEWIEDPVYHMSWVGNNYVLKENQIYLDIQIISNDGVLYDEPTSFGVEDGLIQWHQNCRP
jgi:hypothetical protein